MANYVNPIPVDRGGDPLQEFPPPVRAQITTMRENAVASSALALNPNTSSLEVTAMGGQGIAIRWVASTETAGAAGAKASVIASGLGANFDHVIPGGTYRKFAVPKETQGQMAGGQVGSVNGLYQRVAAINVGTGASSVLFIEY